MTRLKKLAVLAVLLFSPVLLSAQTAYQIMARVDARDDGDNATSVMEMILIDKSGHQRKRSIRSFAKDKGADTQRLMFFLEPADVRGTGFLTYDFGAANKDDDQWMYLPELRKTDRCIRQVRVVHGVGLFLRRYDGPGTERVEIQAFGRKGRAREKDLADRSDTCQPRSARPIWVRKIRRLRAAGHFYAGAVGALAAQWKVEVSGCQES